MNPTAGIADLIDALALPADTRVERRVPKKLLLEQGAPVCGESLIFKQNQQLATGRLSPFASSRGAWAAGALASRERESERSGLRQHGVQAHRTGP